MEMVELSYELHFYMVGVNFEVCLLESQIKKTSKREYEVIAKMPQEWRFWWVHNVHAEGD